MRGSPDGIVGREIEQWMLYEYCGTSSTNPESFSVLFMISPLVIRPPSRIPSRDESVSGFSYTAFLSLMEFFPLSIAGLTFIIFVLAIAVQSSMQMMSSSLVPAAFSKMSFIVPRRFSTTAMHDFEILRAKGSLRGWGGGVGGVDGRWERDEGNSAGGLMRV